MKVLYFLFALAIAGACVYFWNKGKNLPKDPPVAQPKSDPYVPGPDPSLPDVEAIKAAAEKAAGK